MGAWPAAARTCLERDGAWPPAARSPCAWWERPDLDPDRACTMVVTLLRVGPVSDAPRPLSGFIRATLPSGRILFQVRAPGGVLRSLTELAPLAGFLTGIPLERLRFIDACQLRPLSLAPQLTAVSWSPASPFVSLSSWEPCSD